MLRRWSKNSNPRGFSPFFDLTDVDAPPSFPLPISQLCLPIAALRIQTRSTQIPVSSRAFAHISVVYNILECFPFNIDILLRSLGNLILVVRIDRLVHMWDGVLCDFKCTPKVQPIKEDFEPILLSAIKEDFGIFKRFSIR